MTKGAAVSGTGEIGQALANPLAVSPELLLLAGFGWSGSGAVVDFLRGVPSIAIFPGEVRLFKDIDGLINLRSHFTADGYFLNVPLATERFRRFCDVMARENRWALGLGLDALTASAFSVGVGAFCEAVAGAPYWSDAFVFQYHKGDLRQIWWKVLRKLKLKYAGAERRLPADLATFDRAARGLINSCFSAYGGPACRTLVLDQAVNPWGMNAVQPMLPGAKMIIVDRDPRDIYVDYQKSSDVLWPLDSFIHNFRELRQRTALTLADPRVLRIQFENFVLDHDLQSQAVLAFLGLAPSNLASNPYNPEMSARNIGIYKTWPDQAAIRAITTELAPYCHPGHKGEGVLTS